MPQLYTDEHRYQVRILDSTDKVEQVFDDLIAVYYKKEVNRVGLAVLTVPENHCRDFNRAPSGPHGSFLRRTLGHC